MDEALALPTEKTARIALRTQQVIGHETGVAHVADPLGGSWFVEQLTDEIDAAAEGLFAEIATKGDGSMLEGVYAGIDEGWFQGLIADAAFDFERRVADGRRVVVGVNRFTEGNDEAQPDLLAITAEDEQRQIKRLAEVKADRNRDAVDDALARLAVDAHAPDANLMPALLNAVQAYATVGEIMGTLGDVFGRYVERPVF
jgi:methylmalonyl-CoA mutase N-terminal domain/subunit